MLTKHIFRPHEVEDNSYPSSSAEARGTQDNVTKWESGVAAGIFAVAIAHTFLRLEGAIRALVRLRRGGRWPRMEGPLGHAGNPHLSGRSVGF